MIIQDFTKALNDLFTPQNYHDFCPNGLIVNTTPNSLPREIHKVITGVSLRMDLIMAAVKEQADAIIMDGMGRHFDARLQPYYLRARPKLEAYYLSLNAAQ